MERTRNFEATDEFVKNKKEELDKAKERGQLIGIKSMKVWEQDTESVKVEYQMIDEYANSNPNHVKLYNEFVANCPAKIKPEEPVCAQELYAVLDNCIPRGFDKQRC